MAGSRVPKQIPSFNTYINNTDDNLNNVNANPPNWQRMGLSQQNVSDWSSKRIYWRDTLYKKYSDPVQSTSIIKTEVKNFIKAFAKFAQPLLNIMAADPDANEEDEKVYRFKRFRKNPTTSETAIEEKCYAVVQSLGGGSVKFKCRTSEDTKRASLAAGATGVQIVYKVGDPAPTDAEAAGLLKQDFSGSTGTLPFGAANQGKKLRGWVRWHNSKHPNLDGPWTAFADTMIT